MDQILEAIDGYISIDVLPLSSSRDITVSGMVCTLNTRNSRHIPRYSFLCLPLHFSTCFLDHHRRDPLSGLFVVDTIIIMIIMKMTSSLFFMLDCSVLQDVTQDLRECHVLFPSDDEWEEQIRNEPNNGGQNNCNILLSLYYSLFLIFSPSGSLVVKYKLLFPFSTPHYHREHHVDTSNPYFLDKCCQHHRPVVCTFRTIVRNYSHVCWKGDNYDDQHTHHYDFNVFTGHVE